MDDGGGIRWLRNDSVHAFRKGDRSSLERESMIYVQRAFSGTTHEIPSEHAMVHIVEPAIEENMEPLLYAPIPEAFLMLAATYQTSLEKFRQRYRRDRIRLQDASKAAEHADSTSQTRMDQQFRREHARALLKALAQVIAGVLQRKPGQKQRGPILTAKEKYLIVEFLRRKWGIKL